MNRLTKLTLRGFKSIREMTDFPLTERNVLIGANGSGKSNLISFFRLLNWMTPPPGNLQLQIGQMGRANAILHDGAAVTQQIEAELTFATDQGVNEYYMRLFHAAPDTLIFADERLRFSRAGLTTRANWTELGSGHGEAKIRDEATTGNKTAKTILHLLKNCVVYQFHNTSNTARIRQTWNKDDARFLKEDGGNLAPFLYRLRESKPKHYALILETVRQAAPFFADFVLEPERDSLLLQWQERNSDLVFGAHQASDGTLRFIALCSLLLQPEDELPDLIILDEPELGLHPGAIAILAGLLKSASIHAQVVLATQSMTLVDHFDLEDIVVVERAERQSTFRRPEPDRLTNWLDEYSLGELWEKNVIGGRPSA